MPIQLIISGGQSGADQAGWRAAVESKIETGGWMPKGFRTEYGPRPEFAAMYNARANQFYDYPPRTKQNAEESDCTLWFGFGDSLGFHATLRAANQAGKPVLSVFDPEQTPPSTMATLVGMKGFEIINVAGNRESQSHGIGKWVEQYLLELFKITNGESNGSRNR